MCDWTSEVDCCPNYDTQITEDASVNHHQGSTALAEINKTVHYINHVLKIPRSPVAPTQVKLPPVQFKPVSR